MTFFCYSKGAEAGGDLDSHRGGKSGQPRAWCALLLA